MRRDLGRLACLVCGRDWLLLTWRERAARSSSAPLVGVCSPARLTYQQSVRVGMAVRRPIMTPPTRMLVSKWKSGCKMQVRLGEPGALQTHGSTPEQWIGCILPDMLTQTPVGHLGCRTSNVWVYNAVAAGCRPGVHVQDGSGQQREGCRDRAVLRLPT